MIRFLFALAIVLVGCSAGTRSPEGVVRAFAEAGREGNRDEAFRFLGPKAREDLQQSAKQAAELSGRRPLPPSQMLAVGWFPPRFRIKEIHELSRSGDEASVEVLGEKGERETVRCVRVDGEWKVELGPADPHH